MLVGEGRTCCLEWAVVASCARAGPCRAARASPIYSSRKLLSNDRLEENLLLAVGQSDPWFDTVVLELTAWKNLLLAVDQSDLRLDTVALE